MFLIDTHTHLYSEQFNSDREEMILRAQSAGIQKMFMPNIDSSTIKGMKELAQKFPNVCYPMIGLHPTSVKETYLDELEIVEKELKSGNYIAVGEIGIDLYWSKDYIVEQKEAFQIQIEWAKENHLPIVIHCREAFDEILEILDNLNDNSLSGVFHCFTGTLKQAEHILSYGNFKLGIGGIVTYKNAGLDKVVSQLSLSDLVLETDAPYLAPVPFRGKRNESQYITHVAERIADIFHINATEVAEISSSNALKIFSIA